eukprot:TRINITY_DN3297_c0_g1_i1.p1 TRINITY_DN3297_c0_g1~~TRINITY_DN3297_c0_g1_i1.p1  ORF type:complete len:2515 (-),score=681.68 TRINITY_DN3297_c0_g1_i1:154-6999(-)
MCEKDETTQKAVKAKVHTFLFKYDPESEVDSEGSYKHYSLTLDNGVLSMIVNLDKWRDSCYSHEEKYDAVFDLRTDQGMIECNSKLEELMDTLEGKVDKKIPILADYSSFINHEEWANLEPLSKKTEVLKYIWYEHVDRLITGSSGLGGLAEKDEVFLKQVQNKVNLVVIKYDPENEVDDDRYSYKHYNMVLTGGQLVVTVNFEKYRDSCYSAEEKFYDVFEVFAAQQDVILREKMENFEDDLESNVGKKLPIEIDYSFIETEGWQEMSQSYKKETIKYLWYEHADRIIKAVSKHADNESSFKSLLAGLNRVVMRYDVEDEIDDEHGSYSHYSLEINSDNSFLISINFGKWRDSCYGVEDKLKSFSSPKTPVSVPVVTGLPTALIARMDAAVGPVGDVSPQTPGNPTPIAAPTTPLVVAAPAPTPTPAGVAPTVATPTPSRPAPVSAAVPTPTPAVAGDLPPHLPIPQHPLIDEYYGKNNKTWVSREKEYKKNFKKLIRLTVDWGFLTHPKFLKLKENEQKDAVRRLLDHLNSIVGSSSDALGAWCASDKMVRETVQERIDRVIISYDPESKVRSKLGDSNYCKDYEITLNDEDKTLTIIKNLKTYNDTTYRAKTKFDLIFRLRVAMGIRDYAKDIKQCEKDLKSKCGKLIPVIVDWEQFVAHPKFLERKEYSEVTDMIRRLVSHLSSVLTGSDSIGEMCKDAVIKEAVQEKIDEFHFSYDPESKIKSKVGDSNYCGNYEVTLENKIMVCRYNLKSYSDTIYRMQTKVDPLLDMRAAQGQRDAEKYLKELQKPMKSCLKKDIPFEVDWSFTEHPKFLAYGKNNKLTELTNIMNRVESHMQAAFSSGSDSIVSWLNHDDHKHMKQLAAEVIDKVVFTYDPESKVKSIVGDSNYGKDYAISLEDGVLKMVKNLSAWSDSTYRCSTKFLPIIEVEEKKKSLETSCLDPARALLSSTIGTTILLEVDWNKWTLAEDFLAKSVGDRLAILDHIAQWSGSVQEWNEASHDHLNSKLVVLDTSTSDRENIVDALVNSVTRTCQHQLAKSAFADQVTRFLITTDTSQVQIDPFLRSSDKSVVFSWDRSSIYSYPQLSTLKWKFSFEKQLGVHLAVYRDLGERKLLEATADYTSALGKTIPISLNFDAIYARNTYVSAAVKDTAVIIKKLTDTLPKRIFPELVKFAQHPINKNCLDTEINQISVIYNYDDAAPSDEINVTKKDTTLQITLAQSTIDRANRYEYAARIEFEYLTIMKKALFDTKAAHDTKQAGLNESFGKPMELKVDFGSYHNDKKFTTMSYVEQYRVTEILYNDFLDVLVTQPVHGLIPIGQHPTGVPKQSIGSKINSIVFSVDCAKSAAPTLRHHQLGGILSGSPPSGRPMPAVPGRPPAALSPRRGGAPPPPPPGGRRGGAPPPAPPSRGRSLPSTPATAPASAVGAIPTNSGVLAIKGDVLSITFTLQEVLTLPKSSGWKERILDLFLLVIKIARKETEKEYAGYVKEIATALKLPSLKIDVNWDDFVRHPNFEKLGPLERTALVKTFCTTIVKTAFLSPFDSWKKPESPSPSFKIVGDQPAVPEWTQKQPGLVARLCEFEPTRAALASSFQNILVKIDPTNTATTNSVAVVNGVLVLTITLESVRTLNFWGCGPALEDYLKLRPTRHDAVITEVAALIAKEASPLSTAIGAPVTVTVDWDSLKQIPDVVQSRHYVETTRNYGPLPQNILTNAKFEHNLLDMIQKNPHLKKAFAERVKDVRFRFVPSATDYIRPTFKGSTLFYTVAFPSIDRIKGELAILHLKPWTTDEFDLVVETARHETQAIFDATNSAVNASFKGNVSTSVNWDSFRKTPQFLAYSPWDRNTIVKNIMTTICQEALLGDLGFTGKLGLHEFPAASAVLNDKIASIVIEVVPTELPALQTVSVEAGVCKISFNLKNVFENTAEGVHGIVEDCLQLRPLKRAELTAECDAKLSADCKVLPCAVSIDWNSFLHTAERVKFVKMARDVTTFVHNVLCRGWGSQFGTADDIDNSRSYDSFSDVGLDTIAGMNANLHTQLSKLTITFKMDPKNATTSNPGNSATLCPHNFLCTKTGDVVNVEVNLENTWKRTDGCGLSVEWLLDPSGAATRESSEQSRVKREVEIGIRNIKNEIANEIEQKTRDATNNENQRRQDAVTRAQNDNMKAQERHQKDTERYHRECEKIQKHNEMACLHCKNSKFGIGYKKGNGGKKVKCSCNLHSHFGKHHRTQKMPSAPSAPRAKKIPSFGSMPDYHSEFSSSVNSAHQPRINLLNAWFEGL